MNISQTFPIHVVFLAIFPVIFLFSENMHEFVPTDIIVPLLIIMPISLIVFFILKLILKDSNKAALIVSIGLVLFFTYGHFYNIIKGFTILDEDIGRHRYIIIQIFHTFRTSILIKNYVIHIWCIVNIL